MLALLGPWPASQVLTNAGIDSKAELAVSGIDVPLMFIENLGQLESEARFTSCFGRALVQPAQGGMTFRLKNESGDETGCVRVSFDSSADPIGVDSVGSAFHYLIGNDRSRWHRFVPGYRGVRYANAWPGVDLTITGTPSGLCWSAKLIDPGTVVRLPVGGAQDISVRSDGGAMIRTAGGIVALSAPTLRNLVSGKTSAEGRWSIEENRLAAHSLLDAAATGAYAVEWATYFGGAKAESFQDVAIHQDESFTAGGITDSLTLPTTAGALQQTESSPNWPTGFVARFGAGGQSLIYATFLGGSGADDVYRVHAADDQAVLLAGFASSPDFPTTAGAFDTTQGGGDGFVAKLAADGTDLLFSTFLGGPSGGIGEGSFDEIHALDVDSHGNIVVAGVTMSTKFPVTPNAYQGAMQPGSQAMDGFVSTLSPDGSHLLASTYIGGAPSLQESGQDHLMALALEPDDSVVVVGRTSSLLFPVTPGVIGPAHASGDATDGFVARLSSDLSTLIFGTYLGGPGSDQPRDVAIGPGGTIVVVGKVEGQGYPVTPDAFDSTLGGEWDDFLSYIDPLGQKLQYSTLFGGTDWEDWPMAVAVDSAGVVTFAGKTYSWDLPTTKGSFQEHVEIPVGTNSWGFVARFHPQTHALLYSTYVGGSGWAISATDFMGLALSPLGDAVVAQGGATTDLPATSQAVFPENAGTVDAFVASFTMLPTGAKRFGEPTAGPDGPLAISVLSMPQVGNDGFGFTCTGARPSSLGFLLVSAAGLSKPIGLAGAEAWVDPTAVLALWPVHSTPTGWVEVRVPIPPRPVLAGFEGFAQFFWPSGSGLQASAALDVTVQP